MGKLRTLAAALSLSGIVWPGLVAAQEPPLPFGTGALLLPPAEYEALPPAPRSSGSIVLDTVDLSDRFPVPGHQGSQGSCAAWAVGYGARGYYLSGGLGRAAAEDAEKVSPSFLINQTTVRPADCRGAYIPSVMRFLKDRGTVSLARWPYDPRRCDPKVGSAEDYVQAANWRIPDFKAFPSDSVKQLRPYQEALQAGHPVIVATHLNAQEWSKWRGTGTYVYNPATSPSPDDYHAMVLVGYDDARSAFRLMNSWGNTWGDGGFMWIDYSTFLHLNREAYVIQGLAPAKQPLDVLKPPEPVVPADLRPALQSLIAQQRSLAVQIETLTDKAGDRYRLLGRGCSDAAAWLRQQTAGFGERVAVVVDETPWPACEADIIIARGAPAGRLPVQVVNLASQAPRTLSPRAVRGVEITLEEIDTDQTAPTPLPPPVDTSVLRDGDRFKVVAEISPDTPFVQVVYVQADRKAKSLWSGNVRDVAGAVTPVRGITVARAGTARTPAWRMEVGAAGSGLAYTARAPFGAEAIIVLAGAEPVIAGTAAFNALDAGFLDSFDGTARALSTAGRTWRAGLALTEVRERDAALGGFLFTAAELPQPANPLPLRPGVQVIATEQGGPRLQLGMPAANLRAGAPFVFEAGFTAGVSPIDPETMRVELAVPAGWRNLTDRFRVLAALTARGARAQALRLPAGNHLLRVSVQDSAGREAVSEILLVVGR